MWRPLRLTCYLPVSNIRHERMVLAQTITENLTDFASEIAGWLECLRKLSERILAVGAIADASGSLCVG